MQDHNIAPASPAAAADSPLIDIGINLAHDSYDADREAVLARAHAAGVVQLIVTGSTLGEHARRRSHWHVRTRGACSPRPACTRITPHELSAAAPG